MNVAGLSLENKSLQNSWEHISTSSCDRDVSGVPLGALAEHVPAQLGLRPQRPLDLTPRLPSPRVISLTQGLEPWSNFKSGVGRGLDDSVASLVPGLPNTQKHPIETRDRVH